MLAVNERRVFVSHVMAYTSAHVLSVLSRNLLGRSCSAQVAHALLSISRWPYRVPAFDSRPLTAEPRRFNETPAALRQQNPVIESSVLSQGQPCPVSVSACNLSSHHYSMIFCILTLKVCRERSGSDARIGSTRDENPAELISLMRESRFWLLGPPVRPVNKPRARTRAQALRECVACNHPHQHPQLSCAVPRVGVGSGPGLWYDTVLSGAKVVRIGDSRLAGG
jgi:hypothetical protein